MQHFNVVVFGTEDLVPFALSALKERGIDQVAFHETNHSKRNIEMLSHRSFSCPWDNYTRTIQAHGRCFAKSYRDIFLRGQQEWIGILESLSLPLIHVPLIRVAQSTHEENEMVIAAHYLKADFGECLLRKSFPQAELMPHTFRVQDEMPSVQWKGDTLQSWAQNQKQKCSKIVEAVARLEVSSSGIELYLEGGLRIEAEFAVFLDHLSIRRFFPQCDDIFVSVLEQSHLIKSQHNFGNISILCKHSNEVFHFFEDHRIQIGGFRYLRENTSSSPYDLRLSNNIEKKSWAACQEYFGLKDAEWIQSWTELQCLPCDELPVVGPLFGQERVIFCSGFAQQSIPLILPFTRAVASLISSGRCEIDSRFFPVRHRSSI